MYLEKLPIHSSWLAILEKALNFLPESHQQFLEKDSNWLPGPKIIFNAFSLPVEETHFILFGESPYPRQASANGYAFWDAAVTDLWSDKGLSKAVNRATSLRNIMKMLLLANSSLQAKDTSQAAIAMLNKQGFVKNGNEFFQNFQARGILLLNACLVLTSNGVKKDAKTWQPFMNSILNDVQLIRPDIKLILLGRIAEAIKQLDSASQFTQFCAKHPYNLSFINNPQVLEFFAPLELLSQHGD